MRRTVMLLLLSAALAVGVATAAASTSGTPTTTQRQTSLEQGVMRELNRLRAEHGLRPLRLSRGLEGAAVFQSRSMLVDGFFDHASADGSSFGDRLRRYYPARGFASWTTGENLLMSSGTIGPAAAVRAWLASPEHRANLLGADWREIGICALSSPAAPGVYASAGGPVVVITLDFGARSGAARVTASAAQ